jgi:hypothetical protein
MDMTQQGCIATMHCPVHDPSPPPASMQGEAVILADSMVRWVGGQAGGVQDRVAWCWEQQCWHVRWHHLEELPRELSVHLSALC